MLVKSARRIPETPGNSFIAPTLYEISSFRRTLRSGGTDEDRGSVLARLLASNYIKTLVVQRRGWPREFLSQFHKSVYPLLPPPPATTFATLPPTPKNFIIPFIFLGREHDQTARRQLRNGLRIILSYVLQPALTPRPCCTPTASAIRAPVCKRVYAVYTVQLSLFIAF